MRDLALRSDLFSHRLYRYLTVVVTELFPLRGDPARRATSAAEQRRVFQRGSQFIADFASLPISSVDVAEHTGMALNQLDAAFRWHSGASVSSALRRARLDGARAELIETNFSREDLGDEIAARWGFSPRELARIHEEEYGYPGFARPSSETRVSSPG